MLKQSPNFTNAQLACLTSRSAAAKLYLRWEDYRPRKQDFVSLFEESLDDAIKQIPLVDASEDEKVLMAAYVHSLSRRRELLDLFRLGNFERLYQFLEKAYLETVPALAAR